MSEQAPLVCWSETVSDRLVLHGLSDGSFGLRAVGEASVRCYLSGPELARLHRLFGAVLDELSDGGARPLPWQEPG